MDLDRARKFVRSNHRGVLAVRRPDGSVQQTPVLATLDAEGRVVISTRETAYKTRYLREDPWAQVCVFTDRFFGDWLQIEGTAEIVSLPDALERLVDYYRRIRGEHPDWDEYRRVMVDDQRVVIRISVDEVGPARSG